MRFVHEGREAFLTQLPSAINGTYTQLCYGSLRGTVIESYYEMRDAIRAMPFEQHWASDGFGEFTFEELLDFYEDEVDGDEYPEFLGWVWDMERSALLFRH